MPAADHWRLGHRPALDGLRAVAVLLVLAAHFGLPDLGSAGAVGVTIFFTISGFLITTLLLEERREAGEFSLWRFYVRRARRLVPAMLACVLLAVTVELAVMHRVRDWSLVTGTLTYTSNLTMTDDVFPRVTGLGHMWSLAIEEQFYLVWPVLLLATRRLPRRWTWVLLTYGCLGPLVLRLLLWHSGAGWARNYFGPDTHADSLLVGCALAFFLHGRVERAASRWLTVPALGVVAAACLAPLAFTNVMSPLVVAVATAALLFVAAQDHGVRWLRARPLVFVGRRSYGLYLYQGPVLLLTGHDRLLVNLGVALPMLCALTLLSWRHVEQPFLRRNAAVRAAIAPPVLEPVS